MSGSRRRRRQLSPTFVLGGCAGVAGSWLYNQLTLMLLGIGAPMPSIVVPTEPPPTGFYHAIVVPAGGQLDVGPPPHVRARLERVVHLYEMAPEPKPYVITTAWGTPHKPCPHDDAGFERHEAADNADIHGE